MQSIFSRAKDCISCCDPAEKCNLTHQLANDWNNQWVIIDDGDVVAPITEPGRPEKPHLVSPKNVARRRVHTDSGRIILAHALAHIEFNAINLALDAIYRFRDMPVDYYSDWLKVADEEAYHFRLLEKYLMDRGSEYGEYDAHNGLWEMAVKTADDVLSRMALVPRVLEARGLDVTPGLIEKLTAAGDDDFAERLRIIHRDEIGHVAIGSRWFHYLCDQRGLDSRETFTKLLDEYMVGPLKGPFDDVTRIQAGFTEMELADLREKQ
ncbi:MAG: ferritin-like domain-containing protein [Gammaproteobacteria bacterium]|nr:ferritin-like domain-containing protein [Gammaproteobacteria bacterium]